MKKVLLIICLLVSINIVKAEVQPNEISGFNSLFHKNIEKPLLDYAEEDEDEEEFIVSNPEDIKEAAEVGRPQIINRESVVTISVKTNVERYKYTSQELQTFYNKVAKLLFDELETHTGNGQEGDSIRWSYSDWKASGSYDWGDNNTYKFTYQIKFSFNSNSEQEQALTNKLTEIYEELELSKKTDYQKVETIYDYITKNVTYDHDHLQEDYPLQYTAYAALIDGTSVCEGYALLLYRMALDNNIDTRIIANRVHAWNIVKLGNYYYNLDATLDAEKDNYSYYLKSNDDFSGHTRLSKYNTEEFNNKFVMAPYNFKFGDINCNNTIDLTDVLIELKSFFNHTDINENPAGDLDNNGELDLTDVLMLLKMFFATN